MLTVGPEGIRNVALVGHGGAGKTTLVEALLHRSGATSRMGRVEDGSTVTDFDPEEQRRHVSLSLALAPVEVEGHKVNVLDTPGDADFQADVRAALRAADLAVVVVSAVEGVEVQTEAVWAMAEEAGVPRMFFVNKMDRDRASFDRTLQQLHDVFGAGVTPLELPIGEESAFRGVADVLTDTAWLDDGTTATPGPVPPELDAREHEVHDALVERIVETDDALLEQYLDGIVPGVEELDARLARGVAEGTVFPVVCGAALRGIGVDRLAALICEIGPSPVDRPATVQAGDGVVEVAPDPAGDPLAFVFKTMTDPYVGHVSLFRVLSGTVTPDLHLVNPRTGVEERLHSVFTLRGKEHVDVASVPAGDIAAVARLTGTATGDTLAPRGLPVVAPALEPPEPVLGVAVRTRSPADEDKLATALHRLQEEDPTLRVERREETHQTVLLGTGETHLQVTIERIHRKHGVDVDVEDVRVPYRETILAPVKAEGRHKKQSGGHGQFGVATILVEPLERGGGFEFVDKVVGGAVPRQFIPAVERGVREAMEHGGVHGFPVVDLRVTLLDGKAHAVDSSEMSFKVAGSMALKEALAAAEVAVLEPVSVLEVDVPDELQGEVLGDLNARRGRVLGAESSGPGRQRITASAPTAEITRYAVDLRSLTGGRGRFTARHDRYDVLPSSLLARVAQPA
jgi:elongation factor G